MTLNDLKTGETAIIVKADRSRTMELGFIPGTKVTAIGVAPMGDPIRVLVKGTHWGIRREDAKKIIIKLLDKEVL